ncbi:(NiFe) hydrogenase maturation protein HypF [Luminiphilus syltensis NOR5-1B]|uniref:Carbamoyltransferase HypF n=1 Tax=Luminiphilus syltensis NOR5-1B TaxID=565045 RepID=B8KXU6_9GAMM|nr:carbamoyltransferase HypF [Luminiphilus syltensis]EED34274.1 (NiFe) hydrogenase maturation protein HypF [Luminiphilus syltensis NOR5-1B]
MTERARSLPSDRVRLRFEIGGAVQGVGFRPFVFRTARHFGVTGHVANTGDGVIVEAEGAPCALEAFAQALQGSAPAPAQLRSFRCQSIALRGDSDFVIGDSTVGVQRDAVLLPDLATCRLCLEDIFDPENRRYLYPFTNCTACGPRYSILCELPYDRANTTMSGFSMCAECAREYADPQDRRFHAEPIACDTCGPQIALWDRHGDRIKVRGEALDGAAAIIRSGGIAAVKGLGGFHLLTDARNAEAVRTLRSRKRRPNKPFALMVPSLEVAEHLCFVNADEKSLLASSEAPIVLLRQRAVTGVTEDVAPGLCELGLMLPYTPLHHLLLHRLGFPIVVTSANLSGEPIVANEDEALARLGHLADVFLIHDRPIAQASEDSVMRVILEAPQAIRCGRGRAPLALPVDSLGLGNHLSVLALGGHFKTAATLLINDKATVGQHIGDLSTLAAEHTLAEAAGTLEALRGSKAAVIACDQHPDYATTRLAERMGRPVVPVQHHVAHVVSVMAEHGLSGPVLGIAWDGTGLGPDGTIWGGEFLQVRNDSWMRKAHLRPFRLPGAETAIREPRRSAVGMLYEAFGACGVVENTHLACIAAFSEPEREILCQMLERGIQSPWTSSAGRLFDAFAAILGLTPVSSHEGEAPMRLEALADASSCAPYPFDINAPQGCPLVIDWFPMVHAVLQDLAADVRNRTIAGRIHGTFAAMMLAIVESTDVGTIALTGGCFQNRLLTELAARQIEQAGRQVVLARALPPHDGGLSLGQAVWARRAAQKE